MKKTNFKYIIHKNNLLNNQKGLINREFASIDDAIRVMTDRVQFDMALLQNEHKENTIHIASSKGDLLVIYKLVFDNENYKKFIELSRKLNDEKTRKEAQEQIQELIKLGERTEIFSYQITKEDSKYKLPKEKNISNPLVSFVAYEGEIMMPEAIIQTECNISYDGKDCVDLFTFTLNISKTLKPLKINEDIKINKDEKLPMYTIKQGDVILCTTIIYDPGMIEILI